MHAYINANLKNDHSLHKLSFHKEKETERDDSEIYIDNNDKKVTYTTITVYGLKEFNIQSNYER